MREEIVVFALMAATLVIGTLLTKSKKEWAPALLLLASVIGSLASGMGIRTREIVEGPFGFLDSMLGVTAATLFVFLLHKAGAFSSIYASVSRMKNKTLKAFLTLLFIAFPSALTGFPLASVATTGKIVAKGMEKSGAEKGRITLTVAVASFIGMIMPPSSIPAMIAANGAGSVLPTPYNGFYAPLLALSLPLFLVWGIIDRKTLSSGECGEDGNKKWYIVLALAVAFAAFFD
ncbi:MAG: hypothetical protein ACI4S4_04665, partial [Candidatus Ornithospirochaeta sp.]